MRREPKYFFAQCNPKYGYMLFPHQTVPYDALRLPSYCTRDGHPTSKPERWSTLGDHSETFETGDRVILYQAGDPEWLRGFWGYGKIKKWRSNIWITADRILSTPLILDTPTRKAIRAPFLRNLISQRKGRGWAYRSTHAELSEDEYKSFVRVMTERERTVPIRARWKAPPSSRERSAKRAFMKWATKHGWQIYERGYPDLLAQFPNGKIAAFEAKSYPDEELRQSQENMFPILESIGLSITTLRNVQNTRANAEIRKNGWELIARGVNGTIGWPDFMLKKGKRKVIGVEMKTGDAEPVSLEQIRTLSALASQFDLEVHVVRLIEEGNRWELYDDTERWLLYPTG